MAQGVTEMIKSQRQLVSDVSHELRSSLVRLRVALELAQHTENPAPSLLKIAKEADGLEQMVSDLLSLGRMESGQSVLEKHKVKLCPLIKKIVDDANFEGETMNRKVLLEHCDDSEIEGDPVLLHSAIENVVRNALRYPKEGSVITVKLVRERDHLQITVDDEGPGVR